MNLRRILDLPLLAVALLGAALASGCAGWPVQEMSNARQAIVAAEKAGAERYAPETLAEAQKLLSSAKSHSSQGDYRTARDEADLAREKAIQARKLAEEAQAPAKAPSTTPGPVPEPNP
ncbi:MAG: DUF4398 domain-containing protein [Steroidobacteraceae bacterium]|nr:DUF4398 domain-containing protein [Steroidobacteraceae bacterium]